MRPRHDSNAHDVPAPQAGALSRLSYGGKKATSPLPSRRAHDVTPAAGAREIGSTARRVPVRRTRVSRENCHERMQFSKDVLNYTCTSVHVENWGDRWDSHPLRLASRASASRTSASTTMRARNESNVRLALWKRDRRHDTDPGKDRGDRLCADPLVKPTRAPVRQLRYDDAFRPRRDSPKRIRA
jgi:hypothetical protein